MNGKVVLFDIDWTLIKGGGRVSIDVLRQALKRVWGVVLEDDFDITAHEGKVARQFVRDLVVERGVSDSDAIVHIDSVFSEIERYFKEHIDEFDAVPLTGVVDALEKMRAKGVVMGVLTGNIESVARLKLDHAGLSEYFRFGAYGNEANSRTELVGIALRRAGALSGKQIETRNTFLIGDSPRDILCGKEAGVRTIAVASGPNSFETLLAFKPDLVVKSLSEANTVISYIETQSFSNHEHKR